VAKGVYLPGIGGTLTLDLQRFAQERGLWCRAGQGGLEEMRTWLDRGVPVIALLREDWLVARTWHYVVLTGYHAGRRYFIAHTGVLPDCPLPFARFERQHRAAGRWFLAAVRPEEVTWPLDADGHNDLALALDRRGNFDAALRHYGEAIRLNPKKAVFWFNLGNLSASRRPSEDAQHAYETAIRLEPDFADAYNNLAHLMLQRVRPDEALRHAQRAVELGGPRVAYYHDTVGRVLLDLRRPLEAAAAFRAAIQAAGKDAATAAEARLGLVIALGRAGLTAEARAEQKTLLDSAADPDLRRRAQELLP
jgi:tetratricopeptide (TPR) repeat protein